MVDIRGFNGGMNTDSGPELLPNGDYTYAMNIENTAEGIVNMSGNRLLQGAPPPTSGSEWVCGSFFDKVRQRIIYFTNNILGYHRIISVDVNTEVHTVLFEDSIDSTSSQVSVTETRSFDIKTANIYILGDNLLFAQGDSFTISGSNLNNRTFTVTSHSYTTNPSFPGALVNIITVSQAISTEVGTFNLTYTKIVSAQNQVFDWPKSSSFNPDYLIKDIKVVHREYEGDLYYFIDPNKRLLKFNYDSIFQNFKVGNTGLCAYGWTDGNYDGDRFRDGTPIPQVTSTSDWSTITTPAWCYYNNDSANGPVYGKLYNWYAVNHPLFAPEGYKVPNNQDWNNLINCLGGAPVAGGKLKSTSSLWRPPNTGATNQSFFTAPPSGIRAETGAFGGIGDTISFWSLTEHSAPNAFMYGLAYNNDDVTFIDFHKRVGLSVRLIKV